MTAISFLLNGAVVSADVEPREHLADVLRNRFGLTGTHLACEQGACGACTVLVDGVAVLSCLLFGAQADGSEITTIEGVGTPDALHPLQQVMAERHGLQCGYCTPGIVMAALDLLARGRDMSRAEIEQAMSGNLCRCTGYVTIVDAIHGAAKAARDR